MESVVNWTILTGNRGAAHGSLQAARPDMEIETAMRLRLPEIRNPF
jgi:hypothetical protein